MPTTHNELLRSSEMYQGRETASVPVDASLTRTRVEEVCLRRKEKLSRIKKLISVSLYDALNEKIDYEHTSLLQIVASDTKMLDERKRLNKILKAEYFVQKPLDTNIL